MCIIAHQPRKSESIGMLLNQFEQLYKLFLTADASVVYSYIKFNIYVQADVQVLSEFQILLQTFYIIDQPLNIALVIQCLLIREILIKALYRMDRHRFTQQDIYLFKCPHNFRKMRQMKDHKTLGIQLFTGQFE